VYEQYYRPLISTYAPARHELTDPGRHDDRPPTWVPLVFHCTTEKLIKKIFAEGKLKPGRRGTVSFTEIPIGELDRMKYREHGAEQVAIGFPRQYIQSLGLTPVWYLKHNPEILRVLAALKTRDQNEYMELSPFIDENDDVAPFQEVRTTVPVNIEEAVWILTTTRSGDPPRPMIPDIDKYQAKYGRIPQSYWHRSHQLGILSEWQFTVLTKNDSGVPEKFHCIGEHYWRQDVTGEKELTVTLPVDQKKIIFEVTRSDRHTSYEGPWRFIDVARYIAKVLLDAGESLEDALPYRLIRDVASI
jgi:hypothetical protein